MSETLVEENLRLKRENEVLRRALTHAIEITRESKTPGRKLARVVAILSDAVWSGAIAVATK